MGSDLRIVPALPSHAAAIAPLLRPADVEEIYLMFPDGPQRMIEHGLSRSTEAFTALEDGVPIVIGGVVPASLLSREGTPWMLGTEGVARNRKWFLRESRRHLMALFETYDYLHNFVDARYVKSVRWLRWLGFDIGQPLTFGERQLQLLPFSMRRP